MKTAVVFGGSGFVGQSLIRNLLNHNYRVKVVTRDKEKSAFLKTFAGPDFINLIEWNYRDFDKIESIISGTDFVVNLIGLLSQKNKNDFDKFHHELPKQIAISCQSLQIKNFVHISALAVDRTTSSKYAASKLKGEKAVLENCDNATILRPSIIFGRHDNFFNRFAKMAKCLKIVPLINNGATKFQPIHVEDLSNIIVKIPTTKKAKHAIYEIGGDKIYSFKHLMELMGSYCHYNLKFVSLPFCAAKILATFVEISGQNTLTTDQVEMLKVDNVLSENRFKEDFAINPKSVEEIVPNYLR